MKRRILVLAVLLIPAFAFTQQRQLIPEGITGTNEISNALKWERTNAPNERLTSFLMEFYNMGVWMASDSVLFEYTGSHGHNQFDFIGFQNWYLEPDYSAMNWYNYSGTDWENVQQSFQTFDELDYRTSMQMNYWLSGSWEPSYRYLYSNDATGRIVESTFQFWDGSVFEDDHLIEYEYDGDLPFRETVYDWIGSMWEEYSQTVFNYGPDDRLEYVNFYYWMGIGWETDSRDIYSYNADNQLTSIVHQNYTGTDWEDYWKTELKYDAQGRHNQEIEYTWNGTEWLPYFRQTATLSAGGLPESTLWEYWDGYLWLNYYRFIYRYEEYDDGTVAIEEDPVSWAMKIFPNPATDQISILVRTGIDGYGNLHITDMYGQLVASLNVPLSTGDNLIHLNLDDLGMDAGQYMVVLRSGSKQFQAKFLVQ